MHAHEASPVLLAVAAAAVVAYLSAALPLHVQGRWPASRSVLWCAGWLCVAAAAAGLQSGDFRGHMARHLLLGMLAPLLLVLAAPATLALRALPVARARRLAWLLRSTPVRLLGHPVVAAVPAVGGLWLLYTTGLYAAMHQHAALRLAVDGHVLAAGYLLTAAVAGMDPAPHRASRPLRAAVLVLALAAHEILARHLYASPPDGVPAADARAGAELMYYGGDAVELALMVVFCSQWYAAARPAPGVRSRVRTARPRPAAG